MLITTAMNHGLWANRCLLTNHTLGEDSGDLMLGCHILRAPPSTTQGFHVAQRELSPPHPCPTVCVCVLAPPLLTQQNKQPFWAETGAEAYYTDAFGMMGEANSLHVWREAEP